MPQRYHQITHRFLDSTLAQLDPALPRSTQVSLAVGRGVYFVRYNTGAELPPLGDGPRSKLSVRYPLARWRDINDLVAEIARHRCSHVPIGTICERLALLGLA